MKAKSIGDSFSTQKFSIGAPSAEINAENVPDGNFGCFWKVQLRLSFSNSASNSYFQHIVRIEIDLIMHYMRFQATFTG